ncbi:hypothetical protein B9Z55_015698 [Caenorhabditis nigoni]|uniref:Uncharacterized protein n=1 Tax=Caenorhabditis nigoni TaxID=1611254 RepID=A0A2G5UBF6_9PELO|nr:hypothetical protein B9Z55_015698 [Caenorhabditis nigoni]
MDVLVLDLGYIQVNVLPVLVHAPAESILRHGIQEVRYMTSLIKFLNRTTQTFLRVIENWKIRAIATKFAYPTQSLLKTMSLCIGLAMTVERWVAVCKPLEIGILRNSEIPKKAIPNIPVSNATENACYFFLYHVLMSLAFDYVVPSVVIARLNYQSILELRKSQQHAEPLTSSSFLIIFQTPEKDQNQLRNGKSNVWPDKSVHQKWTYRRLKKEIWRSSGCHENRQQSTIREPR